jgi:hypothetical protein
MGLDGSRWRINHENSQGKMPLAVCVQDVLCLPLDGLDSYVVALELGVNAP